MPFLRGPRANNAQAAFAVKSINSPILSKLLFSTSDFLSALVELGSEIGLPGRWPVLGRCALSVARVAGGICPAKSVKSLTLSKHSLGFESRLRSPPYSSMHGPPGLRFGLPCLALRGNGCLPCPERLPCPSLLPSSSTPVMRGFTQSLTYSLTHLPTPSLTYSLTMVRWYDGMLVWWFDGMMV